MKGNEKTVISGVAVFVLALGFYMFFLSPKRSEVADLNDQKTSLEASVSQQEQIVAFGDQARKAFPHDYARLVTLGKAVPDDADTASLLVQLSSMANESNVDFRAIALTEGSGEAATPAAPPTTTPAPAEGTTTPAPAEGGSTETTATPAAAPVAPATEAGAATLPIGAVVGTAGLPTLPYNLTFRGGFFDISNYIGQLDSLVQFQDKTGEVEVNGRLMTVDGFALNGGEPGSNPTLDASFLLTTYVTPSTQGLTAGASPVGPAAAGVPTTTSTAVTP